jgi:hypothetical protein
MKPLLVVALVFACACKSPGAAVDAAASATASAPENTEPSVPLTRGAWWKVAKQSRVYTDERRVDADNAVRLLQSPTREAVVRALNEMAAQDADAKGLRAASKIARDAQDQVPDEAKRAIAKAGFIVLHGLVATACADHGSVASLRALVAAIRTMPLPHLEKSDGRPERNVLEQEMRTALDDKTMKAALAGAPAPQKSQ